METKRFAIVGTDARQAAAGRALERAGCAVSGAEQVARADCILLPLPLDESRTPLAELLRAAKPGAVALGGRLSAQAKTIAQEAGVITTRGRSWPSTMPSPRRKGASASCCGRAPAPCGAQTSCCWALARWGRRWGYGWQRWEQM